MTDIVERLRKLDATASGVPIFADAADEIERLRAALATCRELKESYHSELRSWRSNSRPG